MLPGCFKYVVVGDDGVGKSSIVRRFIFDEFCPQYFPTILDDYVTELPHQNDLGTPNLQLNLCDTGGHSDVDRFRPLCYSKVDFVVVCFSVVMPSSFKNVLSKWIPEIKRHTVHNDAPVILVGTQVDLRSNFNVLLELAEKGLAPLPESQALKLAKKIGARNYVECSSLTRKNIRQIFDPSLLGRQQKRAGIGRVPNLTSLAKEDVEKHKQKHLKNKLSASVTDQVLNKTKFTGPSSGKSFGRQWRLQKASKLKRLLFLSCFSRL
ncbi:unnamed protein product [Allacma fusca]|uniref:Uncharacterized protein n=1 Tax=Allacma fusca TaxID=39272 RepID=A0A8J2KNY0_9HEXA|nr:unnamed protein product [Allacma fusca]